MFKSSILAATSKLFNGNVIPDENIGFSLKIAKSISYFALYSTKYIYNKSYSNYKLFIYRRLEV